MKIYTKTGDDGFTGTGHGRVCKTDSEIIAIGCIDELNSHIGLINTNDFQINQNFLTSTTTYNLPSYNLPSYDRPHFNFVLDYVQNLLFDIGAAITTRSHIEEDNILILEQSIDYFSKELPNLSNFILPGGCIMACQLHIARTVCRRAEIEYIKFSDIVENSWPKNTARVACIILNRLSDLLFVMARYSNLKHDYKDVKWTKASRESLNFLTVARHED